jgi:cytochrome c
MKVVGIAIAAGVLLAGGPALAETAEEAAGRHVFSHCAACHALDTSKNAFGPSLIGIVGRKAGTLPRFEYSDAMRKSGITWTEDNLRRWIANNEKVVPGTRMRHVSIKDRAEQDYLIAFIKSLK